MEAYGRDSEVADPVRIEVPLYGVAEERATILVDLPVQGVEKFFDAIFRNPGDPMGVININDQVVIFSSEGEDARLVTFRHAYGYMLRDAFPARYSHFMLKRYGCGMKVLIGVLAISFPCGIEQEDYPVAVCQLTDQIRPT